MQNLKPWESISITLKLNIKQNHRMTIVWKYQRPWKKILYNLDHVKVKESMKLNLWENHLKEIL